jgi:hypothetical protein
MNANDVAVVNLLCHNRSPGLPQLALASHKDVPNSRVAGWLLRWGCVEIQTLRRLISLNIFGWLEKRYEL